MQEAEGITRSFSWKSAEQIKKEGQRREDLDERHGEEVWQIGNIFYHIKDGLVTAIRCTDPF